MSDPQTKPVSYRISADTQTRIKEAELVMRLETGDHTISQDAVLSRLLDYYFENSPIYQGIVKAEGLTTTVNRS